jgi:hypothetical protein
VVMTLIVFSLYLFMLNHPEGCNNSIYVLGFLLKYDVSQCFVTLATPCPRDGQGRAPPIAHLSRTIRREDHHCRIWEEHLWELVGTNADLALGPSWGQGGLGNWDVLHEFPKVLLPDPTVVILSPDRAAKMCDGGRSALAILGAGSGEAL